MTLDRKIQPQILPTEAVVNIPVANVSLKNGASLFLIEAGTEQVMRIEFIFRAGISKEMIPLHASTVNLMLTEGTKAYNAEELNSFLDYYGIFLNPSADRDTACITVYFLNRHIEKVLQLCSEILFNPVFPVHELGILLKKRLHWYYVSREKVQNLALDRFFESIFGSAHPYGRQIQEIDFNGITPEGLKSFHSGYYRPEKMTAIVSGRIHEKTTDLFGKYFGNLHSDGLSSDNQNNTFLPNPQRKVYLKKPGALQTAFRIGSATINKLHPDYPGLKILNTILGGYFGSRLMKNLREEKGYTYGIHSSVSSFEMSGFKLISTEVGNMYRDQAADEIYKEIRSLQEHEVPAEELDVAKNYMSGEMVRLFDGPFALAETFKSVWEFGLDYTYFIRLADTIRNITPDEIRRLAQTYYRIEDLYEVTAG